MTHANAPFTPTGREGLARLTLSGHYRLYLDTTETYVDEGGVPFESRSVIFNKLGLWRSGTIVDLEELSVELLEG